MSAILFGAGLLVAIVLTVVITGLIVEVMGE